MKTVRMLIRIRHLPDGTICTKPAGHCKYRVSRSEPLFTPNHRAIYMTNQMFMSRDKDICIVDPGFEVAVEVTIAEAYNLLRKIEERQDEVCPF